MTVAVQRTVVATSVLLLAAAMPVAVFTARPIFFFAPLAVLCAIVLLQYPRLLFYALLASLPWSAEVNLGATLGTDLPDEPLMLLAALAALTLWLAKARPLQWRWSPLLFILLAGFCWTVVSVAFSTYPVYSLKYLAAKAWYLLAFVAVPLLLRLEEKELRNAAAVLTASMVVVTVVVVFRHAHFGFAFADVNEALQPYFRNHVNYSAQLVMMTPLLFAFFQRATARSLRWLLALAFLFCTGALALSYSRGAWLAFALGLSGFWLIKKGWLFRSFLLMVLLVAASAAWLQQRNHFLRFAPEHDRTIFHENFSEHLAATYKGRDVSTAERFYRWVAGARMSTERPLTGFGPTTFYPNYKAYTLPLFRTWVSDNKEHSTVHNYFLLLLVEQGLPGLCAFVLLIGAMFWQAQRIYARTRNPFWKTAAAAVGAILLMQCTVNFLSDLVETDKVGSLFYLCVAALLIAARRAEDCWPEKTFFDRQKVTR